MSEKLSEDLTFDLPQTQKTNFTLTSGQAEAVEELISWWEAGKEKDFIISGMAGTGKTAITNRFTNSCKGVIPTFTAPTNEATRALEIAISNPGANIRTSYNFLGLALSNRAYKQTIYQRKLPDDFHDFNCMVIDESSMAGMRDRSQEDAHDLLIDYAIASGIRIIWLGDWAQLPPVESSNGKSPIFEQGFREVELTEVKRHGGAILDLGMSLREVMNERVKNFPKFDESEIKSLRRDSEGLAVLEANNFDKIVSGDGSIIVWTNQKTAKSPVPGVKDYNYSIRFRLFGKLAQEEFILPTDEILFAGIVNLLRYSEKDKNSTDLPEKLSLTEFSANMKDLDLVKYVTTNTRATVTHTEKTTVFGVEVYKARVQAEGNKDLTVYIPTYTGEKQLYNLKESMRKRATLPEHWEFFHAVSSIFAEVKHTYCITAHRAQGSNMKYVFADVGNMLQNRDRLVAFKLLYVAVTRAMKELSLIRGGNCKW